MTRSGILKENPLAVNPSDTLLVAHFKEQFLSAMHLFETGEGDVTPLKFEKLNPEVREVPDARIVDAIATIAASRAIEVLEGIASDRQINHRSDLFKTLEELGYAE